MGVKKITQVNYTPNSKNNQPTLVFIHGAWHGAWCWEEHFIPFLEKQGFTCLSFDLPNHGLSKHKTEINQYRVKDYVDALKKKLESIEGPFVLIGHSLGGYVVQKYLEDNNCAGVILMASITANGCWRLIFKVAREVPLTFFKSIITFDLLKLMKRKEHVKQFLFSEEMPLEKVEAYRTRLGSESMKVIIFDLLMNQLKQRKNINTPLLVQCAENDALISIKENKYTARFQKGTFQLIKGIAHDMMLELDWEKSAEGILKWLTVNFLSATQTKETNPEKLNLNTTFPDAIKDLITKFGENERMDVEDLDNIDASKFEQDN